MFSARNCVKQVWRSISSSPALMSVIYELKHQLGKTRTEVIECKNKEKDPTILICNLSGRARMTLSSQDIKIAFESSDSHFVEGEANRFKVKTN